MQKNVTFSTGLPAGTQATFTHEKQMWIAYPVDKNERILAVIDRMIGIFSTLEREMVEWLRSDPEDVRKVARLLSAIERTKKIREELIDEKTSARTE